MELDAGGGFLLYDTQEPATIIWKKRCEFFNKQVPTFSSPFGGNDIGFIDHPDEVAYCRCRLRTDLLSSEPGRGIYVEVEVERNTDNLSLAVVDFEGGGRSSVTFSPETGAVLRERKVRENPRAIEGTYIHLLPAAPAGRRFEGAMGLYLENGHLAFFRRWNPDSGLARAAATAAAAPAAASAAAQGGEVAYVGSSDEEGMEGPPVEVAAERLFVGPLEAKAGPFPVWETTGFCTDLRWAQGPRLSICLAFRDDGPYQVKIAQVGREPPRYPQKSREAYQEDKWSLLYGDDDHPLAI